MALVITFHSVWTFPYVFHGASVKKDKKGCHIAATIFPAVTQGHKRCLLSTPVAVRLCQIPAHNAFPSGLQPDWWLLTALRRNQSNRGKKRRR